MNTLTKYELEILSCIINGTKLKTTKSGRLYHKHVKTRKYLEDDVILYLK